MPRYFNTTENDLLYAILVALTNPDPTVLNAEYNSTNDLLAAILEAIRGGAGGGGAVDAVLNQYLAAQNASMWISGPARFGDNVTFEKVIGLGNLNADPDPASNGQKYYNSVLLKERIYTAGAWHNVATEAFVLSSVISGNTIYVDKNCPTATDTRTGLNKYSLTAPFKTIGAAMAAALPSDVVWVSGGAYTEQVVLNANTIILENSTVTHNGAGPTLRYRRNDIQNIYVVGVGVSGVHNTGGAGGAIAGATDAGGAPNFYFRLLSMSSTGNFISASGGSSIFNTDVYDCAISTTGDLQNADAAIVNGRVLLKDSTVISGGKGFYIYRHNAQSVTIHNSSLSTVGDCFTWRWNTVGGTGSYNIQNSILSSSAGRAIYDMGWTAGSVVSRITNSKIFQSVASILGTTAGDNPSQGTVELNNTDFSTSAATKAISLAGNTKLQAIGVTTDKPLLDLPNANYSGSFGVAGTLKPEAMQFPVYTPAGSADVNGHVGDITCDDNYLYQKTATGWKRAALVAF